MASTSALRCKWCNKKIKIESLCKNLCVNCCIKYCQQETDKMYFDMITKDDMLLEYEPEYWELMKE